MKTLQTSALVRRKRNLCTKRKGSVTGLFAFLLPICVAISVFAINIAYVQLVSTELKIATDASARAAGRAMSIHQSTDDAAAYAQSTAALNNVGGHPLVVDGSENSVKFGVSIRSSGGYGRYQFTPYSKASVDDGTNRATSVRIMGKASVPTLLKFYLQAFDNWEPSRYSIATQVDRDIALILDRSGSMGEYRDWTALKNKIWDLYYAGDITRSERKKATKSLYYRTFKPNVINHLTGDQKAYAQTYKAWIDGGSAPDQSRWAQLELAVNKFCDVLDATDQEELVSVASFSSSARLDLELEPDFTAIRDLVEDIRPYGGTGIGKGMEEGLPSLLDAARARPFASKTIVILTDGMNNYNPDPEDVAEDIVEDHNVTIHTVTFSPGADQTAMQAVAATGNGKHYHANTGNELVDIFEKIANNLPTILTD